MRLYSSLYFRILAFVAILISVQAEAESFKVSGPKTPVKAPATLPACSRPADFSVAKDVATFEHCVELQDKYCGIHDTSAECKKLVASRQRHFVKAGADVDAAKICAVQRDGSYQCQPQTVRFIVKEEPIQPTASPGSTLPGMSEEGATPATGTGSQPGSSNPAAGGVMPNQEGGSPNIAQPPPSGYVPPTNR